MTGFGQATAHAPSAAVTVEIRTVNHRFADVRLRLPADLGPLEADLQRRILTEVRRGRVDAVVAVAPVGPSAPVALDRALLAEVLAAANVLGTEYRLLGAPDVATVLGIPGLFKSAAAAPPADAETRAAVERALDGALAALDAERRREGRHLAEELGARLRSIAALVAVIGESAAATPAMLRDRLIERLRALAPEIQLDPARLTQEAAFLADRADVTEELVRLAGHVEQARALVENPSGEPVGKRLEFLLQEIHREANTVNSKSSDLRTSRAAVELKTELEKVREQIQNLE